MKVSDIVYEIFWHCLQKSLTLLLKSSYTIFVSLIFLVKITDKSALHVKISTACVKVADAFYKSVNEISL